MTRRGASGSIIRIERLHRIHAMGTCFSSNPLSSNPISSSPPPIDSLQCEEIIDDKHKKYMNSFESDTNDTKDAKEKTLFWGIGIENESYLMQKTLLGLDFFKKLQRKRERYSVDYYKNFKKEELDTLFD